MASVSLRNIPVKYPFAFGVAVTSGKTCGVDLMVQKFVEKRENIDWKRNMTFGAFGILYQGIWQYYLFNRLMPIITPGAFAFAEKTIVQKMKDIRGMKDVMIQNLVENGINNTFLFFPCFYTLKEVIGGGASLTASVAQGLSRYRTNFWSDITACWSLWIPAQTINFAFSPAWARVPFVACVSALWTGYVSLTRGSDSDSSETEESRAALLAITAKNNDNDDDDETMIETPILASSLIATSAKIEKQR